MRKILSIIKKNITVLLRSKSSALIVLLGPLLIIFLVGLAFDNANMFQVNIGVYSEEYNDLTESFIEKLSDRQFSVSKAGSEDSCVEDIKRGRFHICVIFPKGMTVEMSNLTNEIVFHVDYSKINLVWAVRDIITERMESRSKELSIDLTEVILTKLEDAQKEIREQKPVVVEFTNDYIAIKGEVEEINKNLEALELSLSMDDFHLENITNKSDRLVYLTESVIDRTRGTLSSISSDVGGMGNVSGSGDISEEVSQLKNWLNKIGKVINEDKDEFNTMVEGLTSTAENTKVQFDKANNAKRDSLNRIDEIEERTKASLQNIASIQHSLNNIDTSVEAIKVRDPESIVSPIQTIMKPVLTEDSHLDYIFPGLLVLVTMFLSILLASTLVIMEKEGQAYFRNFITPTKDIVFFIATYLSALVIMFCQILVMLVIAMIFFTSQVISTLLTTLVILLIVTSFFIFMGMAIGYLFKSEETSALASVSLASVFLLLSGVVFPIEGMPSYLIRIAQHNPFVVAEALLKKSILFRTSLPDLGWNLTVALIYLIGFLLLGILIQKLSKRNYFSKYVKAFVPKADIQADKKQGKKKKSRKKKVKKKK